MKNYYLSLIVLLVSYIGQAQIVNIPDADFKYTLVNSPVVDSNGDGNFDSDVDTNNDGEIQESEAEAVMYLRLGGVPIFSLEGLEYFINLRELEINSLLVSNINLTSQLNLQQLRVSHNDNLTNLDFAQNAAINLLQVILNPQLTSLDVSQLPLLSDLWIRDSLVTSLDVSQNPRLVTLNCAENALTSLILNNPWLRELNCSWNGLTELDTSQCPNLRYLYCWVNGLTNLDLSQNPNLNEIKCYSNGMRNLNIKNGNNSNIYNLIANHNFYLSCIQVDDVNFANSQDCTQGAYGWCIGANTLFSEDCYGFIDFPDANFKNALLNTNCVDIYNNGNFDRDADFNNDGEIQYFEAETVKRLDVSNNSISSLEGIQYFTNLDKLHCQNNLITSFSTDLPNVSVLSCYNNQLTSLDVSQNSNLTELRCYSNDLASLNIQNGANTNLNIMYAFDNFDLYCIQVDDEAYANSQPNCQGGSFDWCISATTSYSEDCLNPFIDFLDANFKNALLNTNCVDTNLNGFFDSDADFNNDGEIQYYEAEAVKGLDVSNNSITSLEGIQYFTNLEKLYCQDNLLTNLITDLPNLSVLSCYNNQLTSLDVSQNTNLTELRCYSNDLALLNIQNGANTNLDIMYAFDNFDLYCIQVDDEAYANSQPNCQGGSSDWCISATTSYSEDCPVLGINDNESELAVTIYPNPARDRLFIAYENSLVDTIMVYSLQGILVAETSERNEIDVSTLASGLYFIRLSSEGKTVTKKFIKN